MIAHLHVHSYYSFFGSTLSPEEIPVFAKERGFTVVALTDTNSLGGAVAFYKACREQSIQPILGVEVDDPRTGERAIVLMRDWVGWGEVCRLITDRHLLGGAEPEVVRDVAGVWVKGGKRARSGKGGKFPEPRGRGTPGLGDGTWHQERDEKVSEGEGSGPSAARYRDLEETMFNFRGALAALSPEHTLLLTDSPDLLEFLVTCRGGGRCPESARRSIGDAAGTLFAELILVPDRRVESRATYETARRLGIPVVATRAVRYGDAEDFGLFRILQAMARGSTVERLDWDRTASVGEFSSPGETACVDMNSPHHWMLDRCELRESWKGLREEIERSIHAIVETCRFELPLGDWQLPLPHLDPGETSFSRLWKVAFSGLEGRYCPLTRDAIERLRREIETIDTLGFSNYFLVVNEIVEAARSWGLNVLGRGSAANSLVSFALGFTGVDPLRHNLYFERFLNPDRQSPPDIDLDFSWKDRDAVVDWVFDRFGRDHVALISTTVCLQTRQAIREVGKALGIADTQISILTRHIPFWYSRRTNMETLDEQFPECRGLPLREEPWSTVLRYAQRLLGFPRHYGIHCGGLVITPNPIWQHVPLVRAAKGFVVTQMDMVPVEALGLIKIDLLGNRSLGVYKDALNIIGGHDSDGVVKSVSGKA